jgi:hypothetical protein
MTVMKEIQGLFQIRGHYLPCGLNLIERLWWRWVPGVLINVAWPEGEVRIQQESSGVWDYTRSADPNDHYRPDLERLIGRQGWHWNWGMCGNDVLENRLTIKIVKSKAKYATMLALKWA